MRDRDELNIHPETRKIGLFHSTKRGFTSKVGGDPKTSNIKEQHKTNNSNEDGSNQESNVSQKTIDKEETIFEKTMSSVTGDSSEKSVNKN